MTTTLFNQPLRWDNELLSRYDLTGPRYTSYPTAPQFIEATRRHFTLLNDDSGEYSIEIHPGRVTGNTMANCAD